MHTCRTDPDTYIYIQSVSQSVEKYDAVLRAKLQMLRRKPHGHIECTHAHPGSSLKPFYSRIKEFNDGHQLPVTGPQSARPLGLGFFLVLPKVISIVPSYIKAVLFNL